MCYVASVGCGSYDESIVERGRSFPLDVVVAAHGGHLGSYGSYYVARNPSVTVALQLYCLLYGIWVGFCAAGIGGEAYEVVDVAYYELPARVAVVSEYAHYVTGAQWQYVGLEACIIAVSHHYFVSVFIGQRAACACLRIRESGFSVGLLKLDVVDANKLSLILYQVFG